MRKVSFEKYASIILLALMIAALKFSMSPINVKAQGGATLSIIPAANTFSTWISTFNVNATVTNVTLLWDWQINVTFDPSVLECVNGSVPFDSPFNFPVQPLPAINNTAGYVQFGASQLTGPGVNGSGVLGTITFKIISVPTHSGTLSCDINFSSPYGVDTYLLDPDMVEIPATFTGATFTYSGPPTNVLTHVVEVTAGENYTVVTESNCTLNPVPPEEMRFNLTQKAIYFNISGIAGEVYFVNVTIPRTLMWNTTAPGFNVTVGTTLVTPQISFNTTHYFIYFTFNFTSTTIPVVITAENIVPEFPSSSMMLTTFLIATLTVAAIVASKKKTLLKRLKE